MVILGLGSNLGDREQTILQAIDMLASHPAIAVRRVSSLYETTPVGFTEQPDFLNTVLVLETSLDAYELLEFCLETERSLGRVRERKWGPRTIDIDILLFNELVADDERLTIPHPRMHERCFVLVPLAEVAPETPIYSGRLAEELAAECRSNGQLKLYKSRFWEDRLRGIRA